MNRKRNPDQHFSFNFLEIILVGIVVLIFMAILFPVLSNARTGSHVSSCESNLLSLGMALKVYADDYGRYPITKTLTTELMKEGYINQGNEFKCPADNSTLGDTYSVGYLGGHPRTIANTDPLIVCGWHSRIGTLAVFSDTTVGVLNKENASEEDIVPLTITQGSADVEPGFSLHDSNAVVLTSDDGNEALIYGTNGPYFISASYDPTAYSGTGMFTVVIGFDTDSPATQEAWGESNPVYLKIQTTFEYSNVSVTNNPLQNPETRLNWNPGPTLLPNTVQIQNFKIFKITHLYTGQFDEQEYSGQSIFGYDVSPVLITPN